MNSGKLKTELLVFVSNFIAQKRTFFTNFSATFDVIISLLQQLLKPFYPLLKNILMLVLRLNYEFIQTKN